MQQQHRYITIMIIVVHIYSHTTIFCAVAKRERIELHFSIIIGSIVLFTCVQLSLENSTVSQKASAVIHHPKATFICSSTHITHMSQEEHKNRAVKQQKSSHFTFFYYKVHTYITNTFTHTFLYIVVLRIKT